MLERRLAALEGSEAAIGTASEAIKALPIPEAEQQRLTSDLLRTLEGLQ